MAEDARTPADGVTVSRRGSLLRQPAARWLALTVVVVGLFGVAVWASGWGDDERDSLEPGTATVTLPTETTLTPETSSPDTATPDTTVPVTVSNALSTTGAAGPTSTYDPRCAKGPSVVYDLVLPDLTGMTVAQVEALSDPEQPDSYCPQKWRHILQGDVVAVVCTADPTLFDRVAAQGVAAGTVVPAGVTQLHLTLNRNC